jgi:probable rRNA maturation factor
MAIQFFFISNNITVANRTGLKLFVQHIFKMEKRKLANLNYIFCTDEYLLNINKTHLNHNYYTDIITFDLSETPNAITGEIYISTDRVRDNAATLGVSIKEELHRVIFHGALHLCGYKDKLANDIKKMRSAEEKYLSLYLR